MKTQFFWWSNFQYIWIGVFSLICTWILSDEVCLLFLLMSLVGHVLWLCIFLDIFFNPFSTADENRLLCKQYETARQDLHCLTLFFFFLILSCFIFFLNFIIIIIFFFFYFRPKTIFVSLEMSKLKDIKVHFRNSRMKELIHFVCCIIMYVNWLYTSYMYNYRVFPFLSCII